MFTKGLVERRFGAKAYTLADTLNCQMAVRFGFQTLLGKLNPVSVDEVVEMAFCFLIDDS